MIRRKHVRLASATPAPSASSVATSLFPFLDPNFPGDLYEFFQYGSIPPFYTAPQATPAAPQTADQMTTPGAFSSSQAGADTQSAIAAQQGAIDQAQASGAYNPAGNLPITATTLDAYKWWIIAGIVAIAALVLWEARPRL